MALYLCGHAYPRILEGPGTLMANAWLDRDGDGQVFSSEVSGARSNWAGNLTYSARQLDSPASVLEAAGLTRSGTLMKALGARHSFNAIADTTGDQVSLLHLDAMQIHPELRSVTVGAGVTYGQLAPYIDSHGFAVHNLASLPHISVVGACATGTHGSGLHNKNLSSAVRSIELITAKGETAVLSRDTLGDSFDGSVVHLGALGIVTSITLDVEPTFQVAQTVYENLSFAVLEKHLDEVFASGYSVSLFTDWQGHRATQVWIKRRVGEPSAIVQAEAEFFGATPAKQKLHPLTGHSAENCTEQMGIPGPWYERLPHFKMMYTPSSGAELQTEYFVPRDKGYEAILAVEELGDRITPLLIVTELRTIAADALWTSPCYQRDSMGIHFTWKPDEAAVRKVLPLIEAKLAPFEARPHWAKVFTMEGARLRSLYPKMPDYLALVAAYDPQKRFRNDFLQRSLYD